METISIRLDERMAHELGRIMKKHHFSTLTEFVRDAIRNRMKELEREDLQKQIARLAGSSKRKTSDEELHRAGEKAFEKLEKKFGLS